MRNALIAALVGVLVSAGVVTASERGSGDSTTTTGAATTTTDSTTTTTGTTTTRDRKASDRRERSRNRGRNRGREGRGADRRTAATAVRSDEDVSGPCDEAEHANDPRCTGARVGSRSGGEDRDEAEEHGGREAEDERHGEDSDHHGRNGGRGGDDHDEDDD